MTSKRKPKYDPNTVTLAFCRQYLKDRIDRKHGVICPCCKKRCEMRKGTIGPKMIVSLVKMYLKIHTVKELRDHNGDYAKLRHWGLVEQLGRGLWRLTPRGRDFLHGDVEVPKRAITFNRRLYELKDGPVSVFDCYGSRTAFLAMFARLRAGANK
jgi:hypothetical protein